MIVSAMDAPDILEADYIKTPEQKKKEKLQKKSETVGRYVVDCEPQHENDPAVLLYQESLTAFDIAVTWAKSLPESQTNPNTVNVAQLKNEFDQVYKMLQETQRLRDYAKNGRPYGPMVRGLASTRANLLAKLNLTDEWPVKGQEAEVFSVKPSSIIDQVDAFYIIDHDVKNENSMVDSAFDILTSYANHLDEGKALEKKQSALLETSKIIPILEGGVEFLRANIAIEPIPVEQVHQYIQETAAAILEAQIKTQSTDLGFSPDQVAHLKETISIELPSTFPDLTFNSNMEQIIKPFLINTIQNAVKATIANGNLDGKLNVGYETTRGMNGEEFIGIVVTDSGSGIHPETYQMVQATNDPILYTGSEAMIPFEFIRKSRWGNDVSGEGKGLYGLGMKVRCARGAAYLEPRQDGHQGTRAVLKFAYKRS